MVTFEDGEVQMKSFNCRNCLQVRPVSSFSAFGFFVTVYLSSARRTIVIQSECSYTFACVHHTHLYVQLQRGFRIKKGETMSQLELCLVGVSIDRFGSVFVNFYKIELNRLDLVTEPDQSTQFGSIFGFFG